MQRLQAGVFLECLTNSKGGRVAGVERAGWEIIRDEIRGTQRAVPCGALLAFTLMSWEANGGFREDYQLELRSPWMLC